MKTLTIKRRVFTFVAICLTIVFSMISFNTINAYAMEQEDLILEEEFGNIMMLSGGSGRSAHEGIIFGTTTSTLSIGDLTSVKYISNSNYFLINPQHAVNDGSDNAGGTCTTVAMQMLLGYHNYYSDRRIIPAVAANGTRFLDANYGDLAFHPDFQRVHVTDTWSGGVIIKRGCEYLGTQKAVYQDIFNRTWISSWYGIGQAVGLVKDGALRFMNAHTPQVARNNISLTSGIFSASTARADIDAGRPIVLGYQPIFTGADSFHVVPAYGYAKLDGVDGFLVHYGWGASRTQVWVPASWFAFQIRMSVNHTHSFVNTIGTINSHGIQQCIVCNYRKPNEHSYTHSKLNSTQHIKKCACGSQVQESHNFTYYQDAPIIATSLIMPLASDPIPRILGTHTARCWPCGYSITESHEAEWCMLAMKYSCKKCGYY